MVCVQVGRKIDPHETVNLSSRRSWPGTATDQHEHHVQLLRDGLSRNDIVMTMASVDKIDGGEPHIPGGQFGIFHGWCTKDKKKIKGQAKWEFDQFDQTENIASDKVLVFDAQDPFSTATKVIIHFLHPSRVTTIGFPFPNQGQELTVRTLHSDQILRQIFGAFDAGEEHEKDWNWTNRLLTHPCKWVLYISWVRVVCYLVP